MSQHRTMGYTQRENSTSGKTEGTYQSDQPDRRLAQPFSGWPHAKMTASVDKFIEDSGLEDYDQYIRRGAFLAQSKSAFARTRNDGLALKDSEREFLRLEDSPRRIDMFKQPWRLYALVGMCSLGAAVQGWYVFCSLSAESSLTACRDETAVNGGMISLSRPTYSLIKPYETILTLFH